MALAECFLVALSALLPLPTSASPAEARLYDELLAEYVKEERPVLDHNLPVEVTLGIILQQLVDVNEREEQLEVNAWLKYSWKDENLRWDPLLYDNVSDLRHPAGSIWQPDVLLYNSVDPAFDSTYKVNILSYSDGSVSWLPPGIFKISCKIDIYYFPFDTQVCFFKFGSWSFSGKMIDLRPGEFDFSEYMPNGEWIIQEYWANRTEKFYACCPDEAYPDIKFYLVLRRRTLYYTFNFIFPCLLTMLLVVLGFTLCPESGEKIGLEITVSLAICVFLTIMMEMTPHTSEAVPLLGLFFQSCMVISIIATAFTVYVQSFHFRNHQCGHRMGFWMRFLLLEWAPWLLRMDMPKRVNNWSTIKQSWKERNKERDEEEKTAFEWNEGTGMALAAMGSAMKENFEGLIFQVKMGRTVHDRQTLERLRVLDKIYQHVKMIREHDDGGEEDRNVAFEWRFAAIVVDRLCLFAFLSLMLFTIVTLALRAPHLYA